MKIIDPKMLLATAALLIVSALPAQAQDLAVARPWVRAMVTGQSATGAYMELTAGENLKLIGVATPVAKVAEIHQMSMAQNVMKMQPVRALELPAGKSVELRPNSYHIMLMGIAKPLKAGESVPITLRVEDAAKKIRTVEVQAEVRPLSAGAPAAAPAEHDHAHMH